MMNAKNILVVLIVLLLGAFARLHAQHPIQKEQIAWHALERAVMSAMIRQASDSDKIYVKLSWKLTKMREFRIRRVGVMSERKMRLPDPFSRIKNLQITCRGYIHENHVVVPAACAKPQYRENYDAELVEAVSWTGVSEEMPENTKKRALYLDSKSAEGEYLFFVLAEAAEGISGK